MTLLSPRHLTTYTDKSESNTTHSVPFKTAMTALMTIDKIKSVLYLTFIVYHFKGQHWRISEIVYFANNVY